MAGQSNTPLVRSGRLYDVVVIGAGPAGSHVAAMLAATGHNVLVADQNQQLEEPVCCTGIIGLECVSAYSIDEELVHRWANSAKLFSPSGRMLKVWRPQPQAAVVDRAGLNQALARRAQAQGAHYLLDTVVQRVRIGDDRVRIDAERQRERESIEARAVVLATGFAPTLFEGLGLGKPRDSALGAHAEVSTPDVEEVEVYMGREFAPGFFAWLAPTSPGRALVGLMTRRAPRVHLERLISFLTAKGKVKKVGTKPSYRAIPLSRLPRTYTDRLLVVGSAAGQVKPTTGGGVYYALLCADIAAKHLDRALTTDDLSKRNLAGYEREWNQRLGPELKTGYWARKVFEHFSDLQIERVFHVVESSRVLEALAASEELSFDWHGGFVTRALGYQALLKTIAAMGLPSSLGGRLFSQGQSPSMDVGIAEPRQNLSEPQC